MLEVRVSNDWFPQMLGNTMHIQKALSIQKTPSYYAGYHMYTPMCCLIFFSVHDRLRLDHQAATSVMDTTPRDVSLFVKSQKIFWSQVYWSSITVVLGWSPYNAKHICVVRHV